MWMFRGSLTDDNACALILLARTEIAYHFQSSSDTSCSTSLSSSLYQLGLFPLNLMHPLTPFDHIREICQWQLIRPPMPPNHHLLLESKRRLEEPALAISLAKHVHRKSSDIEY